ncbi:hypothetical protein B0T11DRAFT_81291 [Plectosphaerella cucumerina]|uniref:Uncharacterized protein n=1 Tax=Plectosphaerella cucumerina TaxID=40658 RepID=A0A8K0TIP1_9PEZI|nr:hypothetical protein B0T11DRAFT_81291 [Plectosphaerella cucumerina]
MNQAIRFVAGAKKSPTGTIYLKCHVKPGAAKAREGVLAVGNEAIELCVSAQAREGEANKAVVKLLSEVLNISKSDLQITHGMKARDKTVALSGITDGQSSLEKITTMLKAAAE